MVYYEIGIVWDGILWDLYTMRLVCYKIGILWDGIIFFLVSTPKVDSLQKFYNANHLFWICWEWEIVEITCMSDYAKHAVLTG